MTYFTATPDQNLTDQDLTVVQSTVEAFLSETVGVRNYLSDEVIRFLRTVSSQLPIENNSSQAFVGAWLARLEPQHNLAGPDVQNTMLDLWATF